MNKKKIILSIICNCIIVVLCAICVCLFFNPTYISRNGSDEPVRFVCFRYYTVLSNCLMSIVSLISIIFNTRRLITNKDNPKWLYIIKHISTVAVSVTFITVVIFLAPVIGLATKSIKGYFSLFTKTNFVLHFFNPVLAVLTFVLLEKDTKLDKFVLFLGDITVVLYSFVYLTNVVITKIWNDFYYFTFGGHMFMVPISLIVMYGLGLLISFIIFKLYNKQNNKNY